MNTKLPSYVWTLIALLSGLILGGTYSDALGFIAGGTKTALNLFIKIVPLVIIFALAPAVSKLTGMGKGGKLAGGIIVWYLMTSTAAGLLGVAISSLLFDISFAPGEGSMVGSALEMFAALGSEGGASLPLIAILVAVVLGLAAIRIPALDKILKSFDSAMANSAPVLGLVMPFIVFFLGITLGVNMGATESIKLYAWMTLYTFGLCALWWMLYVFVVLRVVAGQPIRKVLETYYLPTALFAAGTCSSLATLPINLANVKKYGVSPPVANFVIPIGAVINLDTSALAYVAYAPFIMTVVFDLPVSWAALLIAWPAVVVFTIAAPGLPAGMGTALWSSTLFASLFGLTGDAKTEFITTWIALSGGLPDMLRTATNCTGDGFTAILFDTYFGRKKQRTSNMRLNR